MAFDLVIPHLGIYPEEIIIDIPGNFRETQTQNLSKSKRYLEFQSPEG